MGIAFQFYNMKRVMCKDGGRQHNRVNILKATKLYT